MTSVKYENEEHEDGSKEPGSIVSAESCLFTALPSPRQDLEFVRLKSLYLGHGLSVNEPEFSASLGLFTSDGIYNRMAYVLADSNEISIKVSLYNGTDKCALAGSREFGNRCLLFAMIQAAEYAEALDETMVDMSGRQRIDIPLFRFDAFLAAWHNACVHNSWYRMVPPYIDIFDDRLEIVSAGGLPEGMTEDEFFAGTGRPVNPELKRVMEQLGFTGPAEHGVQCITAAYGKNAFRISDNSITAVIPFAFRRANEFIADSAPNARTKQILLHRKVLNLLKDNPRMTISQLSAACGVSTASITNYLSRMTKDGLIAREGSRKTGSWKVL